MSKSFLSYRQKIDLANWVAARAERPREAGVTRDELARIASAELGYSVTAHNLQTSENAMGVSLVVPRPAHRKPSPDKVEELHNSLDVAIEVLREANLRGAAFDKRLEEAFRRIASIGDQLNSLRASLAGAGYIERNVA